MKKLLTAIAFYAGCASSIAAGPYDGIYQYGSSPIFISVHQNGNTVVGATMSSTALFGVNISVGPGFSVAPSSIDNWNYAIGLLNGNAARVTGVGVYGACTVTSDVVFDGVGNLSSTFVGAVNTAFGNQQGVNCAALYQSIIAAIGPTLTLRKIF